MLTPYINHTWVANKNLTNIHIYFTHLNIQTKNTKTSGM